MKRRLAWSLGWKLLLLAAFGTYYLGQELGYWLFR